MLTARNETCTDLGELKVAEAGGDSAWGCLGHVEVALIDARGVFLADHDQGVLAGVLNRP